jgi:hypothetical protein
VLVATAFLLPLREKDGMRAKSIVVMLEAKASD